MKRCVRWIIGVLLALAVTIYLLLLALPHLLNPNDYKGVITDLVRQKTGRELTIVGDIQLQISPWLDVTCTLGKIRLANNALFPNTIFAESEQANLELSLWPLLLQKRLHMAGITLKGFTLNLQRTKEGVSNWEPPAEGPELTEPAAKAAGESTAVNSDQKLPLLQKLVPTVTGLDLGRIQLSQTTVRFDNRQTGRLIVLKDLRFKSGRISDKGPSPFEAAFHLSHVKKTADKAEIIHSGDMVLQGNATLLSSESRLLIEHLRMSGTLKGQPLPRRGLRVAFFSNSEIELRQQKVTLKDFSLSHDDISLQGSGTVEDFSSPRFNLSLKVPEGSPQSLLKQLDTTLPLLRNSEAFSRVSADLLVKGTMEEIAITDLTVQLDETTITGAVTVRNRTRPAYEAILHINHLDLDRYGRQKTEVRPATTGQAFDAVTDDEPAEVFPPIIPVDLLKALRLQLDLRIDSLRVNRAQFSKVRIKLAGKDGLLQLDPLTAHLYGGDMKLKARMDVTGDLPNIQVKKTMTKVQLGPLFLDTTSRPDLTGTAHIETEINTSGLSRQDLKSQLKGTVRFEILHGEIKPIHILQVIRATAARHQEVMVPELPGDTAAEATGFDRLSGSGLIEEGIVYNNDLMAASALMQLTGAGRIDLVRGLIDLLLKVSLSPELVHDEAMGLTEFSGAIIPYTIIGPFSDLSQEASVTQAMTREEEKQPTTLPEQTDQQTKDTDTSPVFRKRGAVGD